MISDPSRPTLPSALIRIGFVVRSHFTGFTRMFPYAWPKSGRCCPLLCSGAAGTNLNLIVSRPQRSDIVKAAYEPTDEECEWKADEEEELTVSKQVQVTYTPACFLSDRTPSALLFPLCFIRFHFMHLVNMLIQN